MNAKQLIYAQILQEIRDDDLSVGEWGEIDWPAEITPENEESLWQAVIAAGKYNVDWLRECLDEFRNSGISQSWGPEGAQHSRHYESRPVVRKVGDVWIGWVYWYGGGKHAEPESIDWLEPARILDLVSEKETVVIERTFKAASDQA